jgi:D-galactarolactone cycloisomerase
VKITAIDVFILSTPSSSGGFWSSQCRHSLRKSLLARIQTDSGLTGWGEGGQYGPGEPAMSAIIYVLAPLLLGQDPSTVAVHWTNMYSATRDFGRKGTLVEAISALDIALWDLLGKAHGVPVYSLLGGAFRKTIRTYATGFYYDGDEPLALDKALSSCTEEAAQYLESGHHAVKVKTGLMRPEDDLKRIAAARNVIGDDRILMVDANHAYTSSNASRMAKGMEELNVFWFEEPVPPEDIIGYQRVKSSTTIAIAGGECEYTRYGFEKWLSSRALDIVQPDPCCAGGISEVRKIADMASAFHVACIPHVWGSGVAVAVGLHLLASLAPTPHTANPIAPYNEPMLEWDSTPNPLRTALLASPLQPKNGEIAVPEGPGLGVEISGDFLRSYTVAHKRIESDAFTHARGSGFRI